MAEKNRSERREETVTTQDPFRTKEVESVTAIGNPGKPAGDAGEEMLDRMNESHTEVTKWGISFLDFAPEDQVLDIGCGGGATLKRMSEKMSSGQLYGVDYSATSVKKTSLLNEADIKSGKMKVTEASVEALPFADDTFHKITTVESFYFWPNPVESLKEVRRVLRPNGSFLLIADIYGDASLTEEERENIKKYDLFNPTKAEFQQMFEAAGFAKTILHMKEGTNFICVEGVK